MGRVRCPYCKGGTKRFGKTKAGSQRWRCLECGATFTRKIDNTAKLLDMFLGWLLGGRTQDELPVPARTFRHKCARFWSIWPLAPATGEVHRVVFVDGIYLARNVVVLIASTEEHVIGWYMARSESSRSWSALMSPIPPPDVVVTDGGSGFEKARRRLWPETKVQRCVFHAFCQVRKRTTTRPNLQAGAELYGLAKDLLRVETADAAAEWLQAYNDWCSRWEGFLAEKTMNGETGKWDWTHERLVSARNGLNALIRRGVLFTFLEPELAAEGPLPRTNNRIEGGVNAQLREMLRRHRGLSTLRRAKAVYWWCYLHSECPLPASEILRTMPTDDDIADLYRRLAYGPRKRDGPQEWGDGLVWSELHHSTPWQVDWD
jgi:hypothetical protein